MAPEHMMIPWLVSLSSEYLNADLQNPAMRRMDLTDTGLPNESKTLIWCSHVFEHIPDDSKAFVETYRVLAPGGILVVQVPVVGETTYEDPAVTADEERLEKFLQEDHVRLYGRDIRLRIEAAGYECEMLSTADLPVAEQILYSVRAPVFQDVFVCKKPD